MGQESELVPIPKGREALLTHTGPTSTITQPGDATTRTDADETTSAYAGGTTSANAGDATTSAYAVGTTRTCTRSNRPHLTTEPLRGRLP